MKTTRAIERLHQVQEHLSQYDSRRGESATNMTWPVLPPRAAYLALRNGKRRNALSLAVLRSLRDQLHTCNRSPADGQVRILPPFKPEILAQLETACEDVTSEARNRYGWLLDEEQWQQHRSGLPSVIVLRSEGTVFSSGHDLGELRTLSHDEVKETFALCAEVMSLIRRSPAPVIGVIQGLATAAGAQLALTTDPTHRMCFNTISVAWSDDGTALHIAVYSSLTKTWSRIHIQNASFSRTRQSRSPSRRNP